MPKFRLDDTNPKDDGTGHIIYQVWALSDDDPPLVVRHYDVSCPYEEVQVILDAPANQKEDLLVAMLLKNHAGWTKDELINAIANNENARIVDAEFDILVEGVGGYPYTFDL